MVKKESLFLGSQIVFVVTVLLLSYIISHGCGVYVYVCVCVFVVMVTAGTGKGGDFQMELSQVGFSAHRTDKKVPAPPLLPICSHLYPHFLFLLTSTLTSCFASPLPP